MTTLKDALGPMARPLARTVACWRLGSSWRKRVIRWAYPDLGKALDDIATGLENVIGPL